MRERQAALVIAAAVVYAVVLSSVSVAKYLTFATAWDHAIFTQYVWLLAHGESPFGRLRTAAFCWEITSSRASSCWPRSD